MATPRPLRTQRSTGNIPISSVRVPPKSPTKATAKPATSSATPKNARLGGAAPSAIRTTGTAAPTSMLRISVRGAAKPKTDLPPVSPTPPSPTKSTLSMKDQIALKRSEAKKAQLSKSQPASARASPSAASSVSSLGGPFSGLNLSEAGPDDEPSSGALVEEADELGRLPVRETVDRARRSGKSCLVEVSDSFKL